MSSTWTALSASVRGNWHEQAGQKNQDAVRAKNPFRGPEPLIFAVSDGHGSARSFRSDRGSVLATKCAIRLLHHFFRHRGSLVPLRLLRSHMMRRWPRELLCAWRKAVRSDVEAHPFSPLDFAPFPEPPPVIKSGVEMPGSAYLAYGATLLIVAVTRRCIVYVQLGDGDILTVSQDGCVARPLQRQHQFYANQTTSLCTHRAVKEFQVRVESVQTDAPALIMLSTDGYANCFGEEESFFKVGRDFLTYLRQHGIDFVAKNLEEWLKESSRDGSGDDITVGLAVRRNAVSREISL